MAMMVCLKFNSNHSLTGELCADSYKEKQIDLI